MVAAHDVPLLDALRARTASRHAALDAAFDGPLTRERYLGFLRASLSVLSALEPALARWLPAAVTPSRVARLRADLIALGAAAQVDTVALALGSRAASYGAAYVIEGSTLGGMMLAERFEAALGVGREATTYLRLRGRDTARHWRAFLDELARADLDRGEACAAATATFDAYAGAMRAHGAIA